MYARTVTDITIYPPGPANFLGIARYGAVDGAGVQVNLGPLLISSRASRLIPRRVAPGTPHASPDREPLNHHVWIGTFYTHFGHFITETLPRLLAARATLAADPTLRLLAFEPPSGSSGSVPAHVAWFALRLGIDLARLDILSAPTRVARLILPSAPFTGRFAYAPALRDLIRSSGLPAPQSSGERIFLSRGQLLTQKSRVSNIAEIEALYAKSGFTILHPEGLSLPDQLTRITAATVLAGENGSAMHWSLFSPHVKQVQSIGWNLALQRGICALWGPTYVPLRRPLIGRFQGRAQTVPLWVVARQLGKDPSRL